MLFLKNEKPYQSTITQPKNDAPCKKRDISTVKPGEYGVRYVMVLPLNLQLKVICLVTLDSAVEF